MRRAAFLVLCLCLASPLALAQDELGGDEIAARMLRTDAFGWEGAKTRLRMVLEDREGNKKERVMDILGRRKDGLLQTMVRFLGPKEIAGTAFLMLERKGEPSEQYIYLSGLKRTRRIVGREREGSFMGSDFTYADMQRIDAKHAKNLRLPDEELSGTPVYVVESLLSADAPSSYRRVLTWVRKSDYIPLRTRFHDRNDKPLKTLYARRIKDLEGRPVVVEARMKNNQSGHQTDLIVESIERRDDLPDTAFTPTALEHW